MKKFCKTLFVSLVLFLGCFIYVPEAKAGVDVAIVGAIDCEVDYLKNALKDKKTITKHNFVFTKGKIGKNNVIIARTGMGKVNTASTVQVLIDEFKPKYIISVGVAGSLSNKIKVGDVLVAKTLIQHDFNLTKIGFAKGSIYMGYNNKRNVPTLFYSNAKLSENILNFQNDANIVSGKLISGDEFVAGIERKTQLRKEYSADAVDMEGAAVAHTAFLNDIPVAIIRVISSNVDANDGDYYNFKVKMSIYCEQIIEKFLQENKL